MNIRWLITQITSFKLNKVAGESVQEIAKLKEKYVFKSKTMNELFTDAFEYKGTEKGIIYLKDRLTGKPTPVNVKIIQSPVMGKKDYVVEDVYLINPKDNTIIADKYYNLKNVGNNKLVMYNGSMSTYNPDFWGAGIRMDQIQISRALELGIDYIPRSSYPQALIYHIKMGFLPLQDLYTITSSRALKKYMERNYANHYSKLSADYFKPIVVKKENGFYLDKSWILVRAFINRCQEILIKTQKTRVRGIDNFTIRLNLSGEELEHWKKLLKKFPMLDKLKPIENRLI